MKQSKGERVIHTRPWVNFEIHMLINYEMWWSPRTKAQWLLMFNGWLCMHLIRWYSTRMPYRPPVFKPFYVRLCHKYYRWRPKYERQGE